MVYGLIALGAFLATIGGTVAAFAPTPATPGAFLVAGAVLVLAGLVGFWSRRILRAIERKG